MLLKMDPGIENIKCECITAPLNQGYLHLAQIKTDMKLQRIGFLLFLYVLAMISCNQKDHNNNAFEKADALMIRISEIEIHPEYLDEYLVLNGI